MFESNIKKSGDTTYISISGKIDMSNAADCEELLVSNMTSIKRLVLDVSAISFIDSTGVGSLVTAIKTAHKQNINFELVNVPDGINEIFEVIGVYEILNFWNNQ